MKKHYHFDRGTVTVAIASGRHLTSCAEGASKPPTRRSLASSVSLYHPSGRSPGLTSWRAGQPSPIRMKLLQAGSAWVDPHAMSMLQKPNQGNGAGLSFP